MYVYVYLCDVFRLFWIVSLRTSTFSQNAKYVDTGRPSEACGRGLSSIRALQLAWRALKVFFRWEWIRRFPGLAVQRIFILIVPTIFWVFLRRDHDPEKNHDPETSDSSSSSSAQSMLQPTGYVTTLPRPVAAGNTMRV